jgi:hypothetical protein
MKKFIFPAMTAAILMAGNPAAMASTDFSSMKTEELAGLRGKLQDERPEEREAFTKEWQKRVGAMSAEEKRNYGIPQSGTATQAGQEPNCQ